MPIYPTGTKLKRDDGVSFTADGRTNFGRSYKPAETSAPTGDTATPKSQAPATESAPISNPSGSASPEPYVVKQGDTLSAIASRFGVKTSDLEGFRSGDPNLIFPGEKISVRQTGEIKPSGTGTSVTTTGASNVQDEIKKINEDANKAQQEDFSVVTQEAEPTVDLSTSGKLAETLISALSDTEDKTKPVSLVEEFARQREALGVGELENDLADIDARIARLDADFQSTIQEEEQRPVSTRLIGRKQSKAQLEYNRLKGELDAERSSVASRLDTKLGLVSTMVNLTGQDYQNATQKYNNDFNRIISITNLIRGIKQDEKSDTEKEADNARANVQIMYNLIKEGNVSYDALTQADRANIVKMEAQAGLPNGFVKYVSETIEDPAVSFLSAFTDTSGRRIQPIVTTKPDGSYSIENISLGQAKSEDGTDDKSIISQSTLNRLGAKGVPSAVAINIQQAVNAFGGYTEIRAHLVEQVGEELADDYIEAFKDVQASDSIVGL